MFDNISDQYEALCSHIEDLIACIESVKLHRDENTMNFMNLDTCNDTLEEIIAYLDGEQKSLEQSLKYNEQVLVNMEKKHLHLHRPDHLYHLL